MAKVKTIIENIVKFDEESMICLVDTQDDNKITYFPTIFGKVNIGGTIFADREVVYKTRGKNSVKMFI